jgi:unspecific monooxygenase
VPPGPRGSWASGNLAAYEADRLGFLLDARERHGGVVRFGPRTTILNDPVDVAAVLRSGDLFAIQENFLQRRISAREQEAVGVLRTALSPGLRPATLAGVAEVVDRHLVPALGRLEEGWHDPVPVLESALAGAVAEIYFGSEGTDLQAMLVQLLDELSRVIGNPFALPERWGTRARRRILAQHEQLRTHVTRLLALRHGAADGAFDDVAAGVVSRAGVRYPLARVADMVIGSLLASQRVPAAAASWLLMALADDSRLQELIAAEPRPSGTRSRARESGAAVAERVVLEVLRLFPPTWLLVRTAMRAAEVGGYSFPAGHHFMISPFVLHRDARSFPDPTRFASERWLQPASTASAAYLPFGAGVHACPGRHLAVRLLTVLAHRVTTGYVVVRKPGPVVPNPRTTLLPDGLRVALRPAHRRSGQLLSLTAVPALA